MQNKNAANRMIEKAFGRMKDASTQYRIMYLQDDILNLTKALLDHLVMQQQIYDRMREFRLIVKFVKAHINYKTQRVLGHIVS